MKLVLCVAACSFCCLALARADENPADQTESPEKRECPAHEEYRECQSSSCAEVRCGEVLDPLGPCTADCRSDCFCEQTFFRHPNGSCVPKEQCPEADQPQSPQRTECPSHEEYRECQGSSCAELSCGEVRDPIVPCTADCRSGCFCAEGYLRHPDGSCVTQEECPKDGEGPAVKFPPDPQPCATNEVWKECVSSSCAETTCTKRVIGPGCTYDCVYGCYCADGFFRNADGICVTLDQCPPEEEPVDGGQPVVKFPPEPQPCAPNEVWKECVGSSCAETTCKKRVVGPGCTYDCRYGCYCAHGFYRNAAGNCVTLDQCPPEEEPVEEDHRQCGTHEEWKVCVSSSCAETTCEKRTIGPACTADCQRGCYCSEGFFRNGEGNCVREDQCPPA